MTKFVSIYKWKWYGKAGHFICGDHCRFHLCTEIGPVLVSTVGEYVPDSAVRKILAETRERKDGEPEYEDIGYQRKYETMVFRTKDRCDCGCGQPLIVPTELDFRGYNDPKSAQEGHFELCEKWAKEAV